MNNNFDKNLVLKEKNCINYLKRYKKKSYTCFSGGKDSLVTLDLAIRSGIKNVVFCDTTIEFRETLDYIDDVEKYYDIKIERVAAPRPFFDLVHKIGFPTRTMRWCCKVYKFSPLAIFAKQNKITSYITGLRREESSRRKNYKKNDANYLIKARQINPIIDWSEQEVWAFIEKYSLPNNPLYKLGFKRVGCWPCPFKTKEDWQIIKKIFPNLYIQLQNTLKTILKDCEGIGIKNLNDFIKSNKWTCYSRPQNSELKGKIEVMPELALIHLKDPDQLEKIKSIIPILSKDYDVIRNSIMINKKLRRQSVKILVEKGLNCIGCGTCISFCDALKLENNGLVVEKSKCNSCRKCINTSLMRGACIMRCFSPHRIEVETCQDVIFEDDVDYNSLIPESRVGLIRTRSSLEKIVQTFKDSAKITKKNQYIQIDNGKFVANAYKSKGFVEIKIFPKNVNLEEAMNYFRKVMT